MIFIRVRGLLPEPEESLLKTAISPRGVWVVLSERGLLIWLCRRTLGVFEDSYGIVVGEVRLCALVFVADE